MKNLVEYLLDLEMGRDFFFCSTGTKMYNREHYFYRSPGKLAYSIRAFW